MDPILKWAGGKRQLLDQITSLFPEDYKNRTYHEPMVGAGAVFFWLEPTDGTINDVNDHLIRFYEVVRNNPEELIKEAEKHPHEEEHYYEMRDKYNQSEELNKIQKAALFLYFNKTAYNGLWRVNQQDEFNVPFGKYDNPTIVDKKAIKKVSKILKGTKILNRDFDFILEKVSEGDLVYFDPPYQPVSDTSDFTEYTKDGFDLNEQKRLSEVIIKLDERGVKFILSNSNAKQIREIYKKKFYIKTVSANRFISCKGNNRSQSAEEILVTNIKPGNRLQKKL